MKVDAIILGRGGSKGIPKKNLKIFFKVHDRVILKPRFLKKGEGIFILKKKDPIPKLENYLIQEFIDNGFENYYFDIRVYVQNLNEQIICTYARISKKIVCNIANNGRVEDCEKLLNLVYPKKNIYNELLELTKKIISLLSFKEVGIDYIIDKTGKIYLIELNSSPGILGLYILRNPDNSKYPSFTINYDDEFKKEKKQILEKIRINRYEELQKCVV